MKFRRNCYYLKDHSGISLIEILVVVIVLGILSGIAIFNISKVSNNAIVNSCKQDWNIVKNGMTAWENDNPDSTNPGVLGLVDTDFSKSTPAIGDLVYLGYVRGLALKSATSPKYNIFLDIKTTGYSIDVYQNGSSLTSVGTIGSENDCSRLVL